MIYVFPLTFIVWRNKPDESPSSLRTMSSNCMAPNNSIQANQRKGIYIYQSVNVSKIPKSKPGLAVWAA